MSVRPPAAPAPRRLFFLAFALLGFLIFAPALEQGVRHRTWDWGPHHALTRELARGFAAGHVPRYLIGVSTGDSPFELYPLLTYALAAALTLSTGELANAPAVLAILAVLCHVTIAALVARLASHIAPFPLAFALGLAAFFDAGSFESGAAQTILEVGLLHGALAQCLLLAALDLALVIARFGARPGRAAALWGLTALAAAAHPSSLLFFAALLLALVAAGAAPGPAKPRKPLSAACHVAIGALLAAFVWAPFALRVMLHGLHFAYPAPEVLAALLDLARARQPPTSFPLLLALGWLGLLLAPLRRGRALILAALTTVLLLAFTELPHRLFFDWMPGTLSRLQSFRFLTLARPLLFVSAALPLAWAWRFLRTRPPLLGFGLPAGSLALAMGALACAAWQRDDLPTGREQLRALAASEMADRAGFEQLVAWAREQQRHARPDRFARLMWAGSENGVYHVAAETGMPAFFVGDGVAMLLRERIEDNSLESLLRFNVRWLAARGHSPGRGDPDNERRFGSYVVRELEEWDGRLARIERGSGSVRVTALGNDRIEVELQETDSQALVALGIGYYPRWSARFADGTPVPVFAAKATPQGSVRVVAAWLPPGRTVFTADGAMASDGAGRAASFAGLASAVLALALPALARSRRARKRLLRVLSPRRLRLAASCAVLGLLAGTALLSAARPPVDLALRLVPGLRPEADVAARTPGGDWTPCRFAWLRRDFDCAGLGRIGEEVAFAIRDHPSSTPYLSPGIVARPAQNRVEYRVRAKRVFAGRYWAATWGPGGSTLRCGGQARSLERRRQPVDSGHGPTEVECELELRTRGRSPQGATVVRSDALDVDRTRDVPWAPDEPPLTPPPHPARGERERRY